MEMDNTILTGIIAAAATIVAAFIPVVWKSRQKKENAVNIPLDLQLDSSTLTNNMDLFYSVWKDENMTELQRKQFEKSYIGQKVVWTAKFSGVNEGTSGKYGVSLTSTQKDGSGIHVGTFLGKKYRTALLNINKGEQVVVTGVIERFSIIPILTNCEIVRKT
tara:strand:- start:130 stop:615 length:486 start_codon:yes stop_codon:yes gene_type:complete